MRGATCYFKLVREASLIKWDFKGDPKVLRVSNGATCGRGIQTEGTASYEGSRAGEGWS